MNIAVFSTRPYDREFLDQANSKAAHTLTYFEPRLTEATAPLVTGFDGICVFVNDVVNADVLEMLAHQGVELVALRCAGFNNVDLRAAHELAITVVRVPAYSPHAVAEHTVGLMLSLNRHLHRAHARVREGNFALDGLLGFDLHGRTVGIIGTGRIGETVARIMLGFGCQVIAYDPWPSQECLRLGVEYVERDELFGRSDIVTLHCPLTPETHHLVGTHALALMKPGAMLVNTSRGGLVDTVAVIDALKSERLGYLGLDVYEEEADLFFEDLSNHVLRDDLFSRLLTFPNVLITGHQGFFTRDAMCAIAGTTIGNITAYEQGEVSGNEVTLELMREMTEARI
jgi:D-lactate dehydrogenase